jgi:hypothetical protein
MADQVQWRRDTTTVVAAFVGAKGEIFIDDQTWRPHVGDGVTAGGHPVAMTADLADLAPTAVAFGASPIAVPAGTNIGYHVDPFAGSPDLVLPVSPTLWQIVWGKDTTGAAGTNPIIFSGNGKNIEGAGSVSVNVDFGWLKIQYNGTQWVQIP